MKFVIWAIPAHLATFHGAPWKRTTAPEKRAYFKGFMGFLMANIKQNGRCFTDAQSNREREVETSAMPPTETTERTASFVVDSTADCVT